MLVPRASSAFVCIRCELYAARPRFPTLRRAAFSTSARRNDEHETALGQAAAENDGIHTHKPKLSENPLGRNRKPKGQGRLRRTTASLGDIKTLGDDAEILVLREDPDNRPSEEAAAPQPDPLYPSEAINILNSLQEERRPITPEEIVKQLNSLCPHADESDEPQYVNQSTYIRLSGQLLHSFTGQQLAYYYSVRKHIKHNLVDQQVVRRLKNLHRKSDRPAVRSEWHPGTTPIAQRLPGVEVHGTSSKKPKPISKNLLVDQILRDLWRLVPLEEIEAPGELELLLKPWQLSLLASGDSPRPLDRIGHERKAKIEIHLAHNVIRITADKNSANYAADDIEQLVQNIETKQFSLDEWVPFLEDSARKDLDSVFSKKSLQSLSGMTEVRFLVDADKKVIIHGLNRDSIVEAERCLIRILPFKNHVKTSVDTTLLDAAKDNACLSPVYFEKDSVQFDMREQSLGRWTLPITQTRELVTVPEEQTKLLLDTAATKLFSIFNEIPVQTDLSRQKTQAWSINEDLSVGAQLGQVLFAIDGSTNKVDAPLPFLASIPGLARVLTDKDFVLGKRTGSLPTLVFNFLAAPDQQFPLKDGEKMPGLSVKFRYDLNTARHRFHKIQLTLGSAFHDVLLPDKTVDVRFFVDRCYELLNLTLLPSSSAISDFISSILQTLHEGGKVTAPNIQLDIPTSAIPGAHAPDAPDFMPVKYLFTGVRFHQSVEASLGDTDISLVAKQGGKLDKNSVSLSTFFNSHSKSDRYRYLKDEEGLKTFIAKAFALADKVTDAAANVVSVDLKSKSSEDRQVKGKDMTSAKRVKTTSLQERAAKLAERPFGHQTSPAQAIQPERQKKHRPQEPAIIQRNEEDLAREVLAHPPVMKKKERDPNSARRLRRRGLQDGASPVEMLENATSGQFDTSTSNSTGGDKVEQGRADSAEQHLKVDDVEDPFLGSILTDDSTARNSSEPVFTPMEQGEKNDNEGEEGGQVSIKSTM